MTNAELIAALRICGNYADRDGCDEACPYYNDNDCPKRIMCDAADALEAAEQRIAELEKSYSWKAYAALEESIEGYKVRIAELESQAAFFDAEKLNYQENIEYRDERIKELEAQMPKEGEWIQMNGHRYCNVCGHKDSPILTNYCPNCGARMRKGESNGES